MFAGEPDVRQVDESHSDDDVAPARKAAKARRGTCIHHTAEPLPSGLA